MNRIMKCIAMFAFAMVLIWLIVLALVLFLDADIKRPDFLYHDVKVTDQQILIDEKNHNPGNVHQLDSSVQMYVSDKKLFFFPVKNYSPVYQTKYHKYLCVFENASVSRIMFVSSFGNVIGHSGDYLYYIKAFDNHEELYCYNMKSKTHVFLTKATHFYPENSYIDADGTFYVSVDRFDKSFVTICNEQLLGTNGVLQKFELNGLQYTAEGGSSGNADIIYYDKEGTRYSLADSLPYGEKTIIPCDQGLLIYIANSANMLYLISNQNNKIIPLFSTTCVETESAFNLYGNYAYLSFLRYDYDDIGRVRYEKDEIAGTYCINLENYSVEKISDKVYNGLYIFDNTGIFACDEYCNIFKLDFEGNVIISLLEQ